MRDAIVFAGTREGRQLYEYCEENGINALFCVATAYGSDTLNRLCKLNIRAGRMTADQMLSLFLEENPGLVIDATHPYATEATAQIRDAVRRYRQAEGITEEIYCRVLRQVAQEDMPPDEAFDSLERAVEYLDGTDGKILAVTGSKGVKILCKLKDFQNRVYLRILPNPDILRECLAAGFPADHMICMQGPFTEEMNRATLTQYGISYLLTKMSGEAGGYPEKYRAARAAGVRIAAVLPPQETDGISPEEAVHKLNGFKKGVKTESDRSGAERLQHCKKLL